MSLGRGPLPLIIYDEGVSSASHFAAEFFYMIGMSTKRRRQRRLRSDRHPLPRSVARRDLRKLLYDTPGLRVEGISCLTKSVS